MKHAGAAALDGIEPLLGKIRSAGVLREKSRGIFYLKSRAYLHFHKVQPACSSTSARLTARTSTG